MLNSKVDKYVEIASGVQGARNDETFSAAN